ncbi:MAG: hypothetical protein AAGI01_15085 [Myxococcota bacterium]
MMIRVVPALLTFMFLVPSNALAEASSESSQDPVKNRADQEPRERLFVTDLDLGVIWFASPKLASGLMLRTALDYRPDRDSFGYLRLNLDSTSTTIDEPSTNTRQGFSAPLPFTDVAFGPGARFGDGVLRIALTAQLGVGVYSLPGISGDQVLRIETSTRVAGLARLQAALELYLGADMDSALTMELLGQRYFGRPEWSGWEGWAAGLLVGLSSEI